MKTKAIIKELLQIQKNTFRLLKALPKDIKPTDDLPFETQTIAAHLSDLIKRIEQKKKGEK